MFASCLYIFIVSQESICLEYIDFSDDKENIVPDAESLTDISSEESCPVNMINHEVKDGKKSFFKRLNVLLHKLFQSKI